jgi:D-alanine-D-alanine ligase
MASAVCMDKVTFKDLMAHAGMPQVRYEAVPERDWSRRREVVLDALTGLGLPVFVKPARLGSSVGISKATSVDELTAAVDAALAYDPVAIVEAAASGIEVECSVIGNDEPEVSEPGQVIAQGDWYDYESKYTAGGMELVVPAPISAAQRERVRRIAQDAFLSSGCSGLARVDFFVTDEGQVLLNELNTIPGFTGTSVFARLFEASGVPYEDLLDRLLGYAVERYDRDRAHSY